MATQTIALQRVTYATAPPVQANKSAHIMFDSIAALIWSLEFFGLFFQLFNYLIAYTFVNAHFAKFLWERQVIADCLYSSS